MKGKLKPLIVEVAKGKLEKGLNQMEHHGLIEEVQHGKLGKGLHIQEKDGLMKSLKKKEKAVA